MQIADGITEWPGWGFWGIPIGVVIGACVAVLAARYYAAKTVLEYAYPPYTRILGETARQGDLRVIQDGVELKDPYISSVEMRARGRNDISPDAFNHLPLSINFGSRIHKILELSCTPPTPQDFAATWSGDVLRIDPCHLRCNAILKITVLTEGKPKRSSPAPTLINIPLASKRKAARRHFRICSTSVLVMTPLALVTFLLDVFVVQNGATISTLIFLMVSIAAMTAMTPVTQQRFWLLDEDEDL